MISLNFCTPTCILLLLSCLLLFPSDVQSQTSSPSPPIVTTPLGDVLGETVTYEENRYLNVRKHFQVFRGIPFAEPPVGDLRFRAPVPKEPWSDDQDYWNATYFRSACEQVNPGIPLPEFDVETTSEDCLYLNVYVPDPKPTSQLLPVMVWIHGGGYVNGAGTSPVYDPYPLMAVNDFIYVSIHYRLGVYGYLYTGDDSAPGNAGMLDQVETLKWIQNNIEAFGGDPDQVTVGGESAGAGSSHLLALSPLSQGLLHRAILQSGSALSPWAVELEKDKVIAAGHAVAVLVDCPTEVPSRELVDCLRNVEADDLTRASFSYLISTVYNELPFAPVVDGYFLTDEPANLIRKKDFASVDLLLGTNADEGSLFALRYNPTYFLRDLPPPMSFEEFRENIPVYTYDYKTPMESRSIEQEYVDWSKADDPDSDYLKTLIAFTTDQAFACPTDMVARAHVSNAANVYLYHMTHVPTTSVFNLQGRGPEWLGCIHGEDLQFTFGWEFNPLMNDLVDQTAEEAAMSLQMLKYWSNFIVSGNPNSEEGSEFEPWFPFTVPDLDYKIISLDLPNSRALKSKQCAFWNNYIGRVSTFSDDLADLQDEWQKEITIWRQEDFPGWKTEFDEYKNNDSS